jgi:SAM-dependent methyltransferase
MLLNRVEFALMNNPVRVDPAPLRSRAPARDGGAVRRCGARGGLRAAGAELVLDRFGAARVDAFDLDPKMVGLARKRLARRGERVRLWVGDATRIPAPDASYDAVFDFGIVHHVPDWRAALREIHRVLKPGGRFFAEEVFRALPLASALAAAPRARVRGSLRPGGASARSGGPGFTVRATLARQRLGWFVADRATAGAPAQRGLS